MRKKMYKKLGARMFQLFPARFTKMGINNPTFNLKISFFIIQIQIICASPTNLSKKCRGATIVHHTISDVGTTQQTHIRTRRQDLNDTATTTFQHFQHHYNHKRRRHGHDVTMIDLLFLLSWMTLKFVVLHGVILIKWTC